MEFTMSNLPQNKHGVKCRVDLEAIAGAAKKTGPAIKFTPEKKQEFLDLLETNSNISLSARTVGISRSTIDYHRRNYPEFNTACEEALVVAVDYLEAEVMRRGFQGVEKDIYYQGTVVGQEKQYSDTLALRTLEANRPLKWFSKTSVDLKGDVSVTNSDAKMNLLSMLGIEEKYIVEGEFTKED